LTDSDTGVDVTNRNVKPPDDPTVRAAKITRMGAIIAAVTAALITGTATGVAGYFSGREAGVQAATATTTSTVTSVRTVTVPANAEASDSPSPRASKPGATSLLEMSHLEAVGEITVGDQDVNAKTYEQVITAALNDCEYREQFASRTYQLDRKYDQFDVVVGLTDQSNSGSVVEFRVLVDGTRVESATTRLGVGAVKELKVDMPGAFRLSLEAEIVSHPCDRRSAGAVWIEPTLS
jgi:hypothetical protein